MKIIIIYILISYPAFSETTRSPNDQIIEIDIPAPPKTLVGFNFSQK